MDRLPTLLAVDLQTEQRLLFVLVQLVIILLAARAFAALGRLLWQPTAVGEIAAGLVLGPSVLGRLAPEFSARLFDESTLPLLGMLSQLGLVLFLFLVGLEFDFGHLRWHGRAAFAISLSGIVLPFGLGLGLGLLLHPHLERPVAAEGFILFMGIALSITALPVLGRIMLELGITRTRLGTVTITAAAVDDACGWVLLAAVAGVVQANFDPWLTVRMAGLTVLFVLGLVLVVRPLMRRWIRTALIGADGQLGLTEMAVILCVLFGCAVATSLIGIFALFGAFLFGAVLADEPGFRKAVSGRLRDFVTAFFVPIFFTSTGLRTDIGSLETGGQWLLGGLVLLAAVAGKFGGCTLAARLGGFGWREAGCVGAMMNTRGLMELVVVNVGLDLGVIPPSVFCMLVLMALLTTAMATPLLLGLMRGTELEPFIRQSGFIRGPKAPAVLPGDKREP